MKLLTDALYCSVVRREEKRLASANDWRQDVFWEEWGSLELDYNFSRNNLFVDPTIDYCTQISHVFSSVRRCIFNTDIG